MLSDAGREELPKIYRLEPQMGFRWLHVDQRL